MCLLRQDVFWQWKVNNIKFWYLLLIKQKQTNNNKKKYQNASKWNLGWKNRSDRSASNIFSEDLLTDKFWNYLRMKSASNYWSYIDFYALTFLYCLQLYWYSMHWLLHRIFIFVTHHSTRFSFLERTSLLRNWNNRTNDTWVVLYNLSKHLSWWRRLEIKTSSEDVWLRWIYSSWSRRLLKTKGKDVFKTSSSRQMFAGTI